jgi:hypothetical protein
VFTTFSFRTMETVFRNQLVSRNKCLRGNVFAHSFPRNGPHVTLYSPELRQEFELHICLHTPCGTGAALWLQSLTHHYPTCPAVLHDLGSKNGTLLLLLFVGNFNNQTLKRRMEGGLINDLDGSGYDLIWGTIPAFVWMSWEKPAVYRLRFEPSISLIQL